VVLFLVALLLLSGFDFWAKVRLNQGLDVSQWHFCDCCGIMRSIRPVFKCLKSEEQTSLLRGVFSRCAASRSVSQRV
jgi:hypothetical protein